MGAARYQTYEEAASDYLSLFQTLRQTQRTRARGVSREVEFRPGEVLLDQAEKIADISASMAPLSKSYLEDPDPKLREGMSGQLLAQAAAELQVAAELMEMAEEEQLGERPALRTRAARRDALGDAIMELEKSMAHPLATGLPVKIKRTRAAAPAGIEEAKEKLKQAVTTTIETISQEVLVFGGELASDLVFQADWGTVIKGTGMVSSSLADWLEEIKEGVSFFLRRIVTTVMKTLINVYDKILALLGKDVEDQDRRQIREWLEAIKEAGEKKLFDELVRRFYRIEHFQRDLEKWLNLTTVAVSRINDTTTAVMELAGKFPILVGRMKKISGLAGLAGYIKIPQLTVAITGIRVALLAALVSSGHDYIGYQKVRFPNLTKGVAEVIRENLVVAG